MNIIITGASRGIGKEITKHFAKKSDNKVVVISRNHQQLKDLKKECLNLNPNSQIFPIPFDIEEITKKSEDLLKQILQQISYIDILINNASYLLNQPFEETEISEIQKVFNVNFFSPSLFIKLLIPYLGSVDIGHVINISGMGGFQGSVKFPGLSYYSASKAALANLTECLAEEYKEYNISFNCLAMGAVQTEMLKKAFPGYFAPVTADQMGEFIANFAINGHKFFNGKIIPVSLSTP